MKKDEFEEIIPFLDTLTEEQAKVVWYMEARKKGNPCITNTEKEEALKMPLIDLKKMRFRNPIKIGDIEYSDTGNKYI